MALIGDTNFSLKPDVNMAAIASLYQKQKTDEQSMAAQQSQMQSQEQDRVMNVMKMANDLTQTMIQGSAQAQMREGRKNLQDLLGSANEPAPSSTMTPAGSNLLPQLSQAPVAVPQSQTPQYQQQFRQAAFQANPSAASEAIAQQAFKPKEHKQIKTVQNPDGTTGYVEVNLDTNETTPIQGIQAPQGMNAQVNLTDSDRSNSVLKNMARAIRTGDALPGGMASLRTVNGQKAMALALEQDPNTDLTLYGQRQQMRRDYTSNGAAGKSLTAFNTAIAHSEIVDKALDKLDNSAFPDWNKVTNKASVKVGDPRVGAFKVARNLFADEMAKAAQGGSGIITENERERQLESFDAASSPEQMKAAVDTAIQLMASKSKVLQDNWNNSMSGVKPALPFVTSQAAKVLKNRGYDINTLEQSTQNEPAGLPEIASQDQYDKLPSGTVYTSNGKKYKKS